MPALQELPAVAMKYGGMIYEVWRNDVIFAADKAPLIHCIVH